MTKLGEQRHIPKKLIDSWTYKVKDVDIERLDYVTPEDGEGSGDRQFEDKYRSRTEKVKNKLVTVNVFIIKTARQSEEPPHPLDTVRMTVECPELQITIEGTDIVAMKDAMWSMLDKKFEIAWERYYQVQVEKARIYSEHDGTAIQVIWSDIYKGKTWDGKRLLRRWRGHSYEIEPWPGAFQDENGKTMACIPATEENRAALNEFCARVDLLREKLADFLRPDVIQQNLQRLSACALLPTPKKPLENP
jgi:hypothetical protein